MSCGHKLQTHRREVTMQYMVSPQGVATYAKKMAGATNDKGVFISRFPWGVSSDLTKAFTQSINAQNNVTKSASE